MDRRDMFACTRLRCAEPVRWAVERFILLMLMAVLGSGSAGAEMPPPPVSLDIRFAAVEARDRAAAPVAVSAVAQEDVSAGQAKPAPPPAPVPDARANYRALIEREVARTGLAPEIAEAVMAVESGYNPGAIGGVGEIGLMQLLPSTARMLGFSGTLADLAVPETNIHYGVMYLAAAWQRAGGDLCTAVMKYRAGHGETRFSHLSVNYCLAVRSKLMARGFAVSGNVPIATFGEGGGGGGGGRGCGRKCLGLSRVGTVNIAALNTQLSSIVAQVRAGR
jgi:soluble lytic murein transglycosylase-like protein